MALENDHGLIGLWALNEPSGAPTFHNYAPRFAGKPSGISFDLHPQLGGDTGGWFRPYPGTVSILDNASGTTFTGFSPGGNGFTSDSVETGGDKWCLVHGGGHVHRVSLTSPPIEGSGFTLGIWVYPNGNGKISSSASTERNAEENALFSKANNLEGVHLGISGMLDRAAQFSVPGDPNELRMSAFAHVFGPTNINMSTPIESGRFTHIAFSFRYVDGASNEVVLYKDGRVAGSGTTNEDLNNPLTDAPNDHVLTIAGSQTGNTFNRYFNVTGFNHLVSGAYAFERVVNEVEMAQMHDQGGLQPGAATARKEAVEISISDPKMIGYYPMVTPGFIDASPNRNHMISSFDQRRDGGITGYHAGRGPFNRGSIWTGNQANATRMMGGSGITNALLSNKSFTIAGWFLMDGLGSAAENNRIFSFGSADNSFPAPTLTLDTACFDMRLSDDQTPRHEFVVYEGGNPDDRVTLLGANTDLWHSTFHHIAIAYDDQTFGLAMYIDGELNASGNLSASMVPQMERIAGSGFPFMFGNGVSDDDIDTTLGNAGDHMMADLLIMGRPIQPREVLFLAQSGIDISAADKTLYDHRLKGYWGGSESIINPLIIPDLSGPFLNFRSPMVRGLTNFRWNAIEDADDRGPEYHIDEFGTSPDTPPELQSFGNLGFTSGMWCASAGSLGNAAHLTSSRQSQIGVPHQRLKPWVEDRDDGGPHYYNQCIISFEVTPSGNIPPTLHCQNGQRHNSMLYAWATVAADAGYAFLTSINADNPDPLGQDAGTGPSGVSIVFAGTENTFGTQTTPIVSGNLPFGVPSRVALHIRGEDEQSLNDGGLEPVHFTLYINGTPVQSRRIGAEDSRFNSDGNVGTGDDAAITIGGILAGSSTTTDINLDGGLGDIFMRNVFVMNGIFSTAEVSDIATNGLDTSTVPAGYSQSTSFVQAVTQGDPNIQGYWRFSGGGSSGIKDLSLKQNDLRGLAQEVSEKNLFSSQDNAAHNLRFVPGPFTNASLNTQASGITYNANAMADANVVAPFVVSGAAFDTPNDGFSVGFWACTRSNTSTNDVRVFASYGIVPGTAFSTTFTDSSWAIIFDEGENMRLVLSTEGGMYWDQSTHNAAKAGQVDCGVYRVSIRNGSDTPDIAEPWREGFFLPGHKDVWNHFAWSYNKADEQVRCYMNGVPLDIQKMPASGFHVPQEPEARILSVFAPQTSLWDWTNLHVANDGYMTDFFYFDRSMSDEEVAFIAINGIAAVPASGTLSGIIGGQIFGANVASGLLGGLMLSSDTGSGLIGGLIKGSPGASGQVGGHILGLDTGSGLIGGIIRGGDSSSGIIGSYVAGSTGTSGIIGALVSGIFVPFSFVGAHIQGIDTGSGLVGGHMLGFELASGTLGGYVVGGLSGRLQFDAGYTVEVQDSEDFDSLIQVSQFASSDFDATAEVFQDECPPTVQIEVPFRAVSGLAPPFNQYFVAKASGQQGKTIEKVTWSFGDFSAPVVVAQSGAGCYPVQHRFGGQGFYMVRVEAIDSDGIHSCDTIAVNAASGVSPVVIGLSGVPQAGNAELLVAFNQNVESTPNSVSIVADLLDYGDGQTTIVRNTTRSYTEPGTYCPIWCVRDSRGIIWCDSLAEGSDLYELGGGP
jgi:hypothetical protein